MPTDGSAELDPEAGAKSGDADAAESPLEAEREIDPEEAPE